MKNKSKIFIGLCTALTPVLLVAGGIAIGYYIKNIECEDLKQTMLSLNEITKKCNGALTCCPPDLGYSMKDAPTVVSDFIKYADIGEHLDDPLGGVAFFLKKV